MSFNIRYGTARDGDNVWGNRRGAVAEVIAGFGPHVLGIQEALHFQLDEMGEMLPGYGRVGVGRDDGVEAGEYAAIFYQSDRVRVLEEGTFWFSDTPEVPGSMSWGNQIPRICTWARFQDRSNGRSFLFFNLHWDHQSQPSREKAAELLLERMGAMAGPGEAILVTGDFNAGEDNPAFTALVQAREPGLRDAFRAVRPEATEVGTFHGFGGGSEGDKIDAVLFNGAWTVVEAAILQTSLQGRYPSDHYPVTAVLRWQDAMQPSPGRGLR